MTPAQQSLQAAEICRLAPVVPVIVPLLPRLTVGVRPWRWRPSVLWPRLRAVLWGRALC